MSTTAEQALERGELTVIGRIRSASNATFLCEAILGERTQHCVYKPVRGEAPLWDFPDGTLAGRELASYLVSAALGWNIVPHTIIRDGPAGPGMLQRWVDQPADDDRDDEDEHTADAERERSLVQRLIEIPALIEKTLTLDSVIYDLAKRFADKQHALFLGRGALHPIAMEGALKLKEISYIHAEAYPAGELKHGPLALVDADMPVITVAPNNDLLEKLKSNLQEVRARGGELIVFADPDSGFVSSDGVTVIQMPKHVSYFQAPAVYTVPLQLLAYHVAILKGTDVDQPRNLAKSVTVE